MGRTEPSSTILVSPASSESTFNVSYMIKVKSSLLSSYMRFLQCVFSFTVTLDSIDYKYCLIPLVSGENGEMKKANHHFEVFELLLNQSITF